MKQLIIIFIAFIFTLALFIGQCHDEIPNDTCESGELFEQYSEKVKTDSDELYQKSAENTKCDIVEIPKTVLNLSEKILCRKTYTLSYNKDTKCPNWVAWYLTAEHVDGDCQRDNAYYEDDDVPFPKATNADYRRSGWSRGHMCPAGDNKWSRDAMYDSFSLVNVCPQDSKLNSGVWNSLEMDCRQWARQYGEVYIVCGPVLMKRQHETIGPNKVVVPEAFFKVVLCMVGKPKVFGVVVRNNEGTKKRDLYYNSVDDVERLIGLDFFPSLPDDIEKVVEAEVNMDEWR